MATFSLKAILGMDGKGFKAGIKGAKTDTKDLKQTISEVKKSLAKAFSVAVIARYIKSVVDLGSRLSDIAGQTGMSVTSWETIVRVSRDAGIEVKKVEMAMLKVRQAQDESLASGGKMADALKTLGMTMDEVAGMRTDEVFERMSKAIVDSNRGAAEMQAITEIIGGQNAQSMLEIFTRIGTEGIQPIKQGLLETKQIMDDITAMDLDYVADRLDQWGETGKRVGASLLMVGGNVMTFLDKLKQRYGTVQLDLVINPEQTIADLGKTLGGESILSEMRSEKEARIAEMKAEYDKKKQIEIESNKVTLENRIAAADAAERAITAKIFAEHKKRVDDETKKMDEARRKAIEKNDQIRKDKAQKDAIDLQKESINKLSEGLSTVSQNTGTDALRNIGANILGSGTNPWTGTEVSLKQQIKIAEKQLAQLEVIASDKSDGGRF